MCFKIINVTLILYNSISINKRLKLRDFDFRQNTDCFCSISAKNSCDQSHSRTVVSLSYTQLCFFKSNQIKSLLLSHHHSTSALVSEILMSVLQTVQKKNNNNLHMDSTYLQTVQKTMCKIHIHILSTHSVL